MSITGIIFLSLYLLFSLLCMFYSLYLHKKLSFLKHPLIMDNPRYPAFNRKDYPKWNRCVLILGSFFLAPIRIIVVFTVTFIVLVVVRIIGFCCCIDTTGKAKVKGCFMVCITKVLTFLTRVALFFLGIYWVTEKKQFPRPENVEYFHDFGETKQAVIIGNHISFIDALYILGNKGPVSFIASKILRDFPLFGFIGNLLQFIYVDRSDPESRSNTFQRLQQRIEDIGNEPKGRHCLVRFNIISN